ncbi:MAG: DUF6687 family protein [Gemmatimonadota bacterium]
MTAATGLVYVAYHRLAGRPNVIVDGSPAEGTTLTLTHWPRYRAPAGLARDLSAQMAFAYLDAGAGLHGPAAAVSNNHFDQDGLAGLFALACPEAAQARRAVLLGLAAAGDFATYTSRAAARMSMVCAAYADPARSPLRLAGDDDERCEQLYTELLGRLPELCDHPGRFRALWGEEDAALTRSETLITSGRVTVREYPDVDLAVIDVPENASLPGGHRFAHLWYPGVHPMAIANATGRFAVLIRQGRRYRFCYRYETWVQYRSRRPRARRDLRPLATALGELEPAGVTWSALPSGALEPVLEPADGAESRIAPDQLLELVHAHLARSPADWNPYPAS